MSIEKLKQTVFVCCFGILSLFVTSTEATASQGAVVVADKAIIYSTMELEGPIGFLSRGKEIKVGEKALANGHVYPVVVSGRIAYIRTQDISFETDDGKNFTATRFYELTKENYDTHYSLGFLNYTGQYKSELTGVDEKFNWYGYQLKGEAFFNNRWGVLLVSTGSWGTKGEEQFRMIEFGFGGSYRFFEHGPLRVNLFIQLLGVPFANYSVGSKFRVNGYGYGGGGGLSATYDIKKRWGVEASLGIYQTRLMGFKAPEDFNSPEPTFSGARTILGGYYRF